MLRYVRLMDVPLPLKGRFEFLIRNKKWALLVTEGELLSSSCKESASYFEAAQLVALVKKYQGVDPKTQSLDPEKTSRATWLASEEKCRGTTLHLADSVDPSLRWFLGTMRTYIESVLGAEPDMESIYELCDFSSGASIGVHGDKTHLAAKFFAKKWTVTPRALRHALEAMKRTRYLSHRDAVSELSASPVRDTSDILSKVELVAGNKLSFVPKTMATHRAIAVEPLLNSFVQRGADYFIRERLRTRLGIDLRKQEPNQRMAREGSISGHFATVDLSSASDTMAWGLIRAVLPRPWFNFLSDIRSHFTIDGSQKIELWKFCSMGNNFCFPLQTLIFSSICHAVGSLKGSFRVYGDDIIIESELAPKLLFWLRHLGFEPNASKTFISGPFRESCGTDWWKGQAVRPAYATKSWDDVRNVMAFHNTSSLKWPDKYLPLLRWLRNQIPPLQRLVRPYGEPDGNAFNAPLDECMASPHVSWDREVWNWRWREFVATPVPDRSFRRERGYPYIAYLSFLRGNPDGEFVFRRKTRTATRYVSRWPLAESSDSAKEPEPAPPLWRKPALSVV